jgi:flagellar assembly factor FliW
MSRSAKVEASPIELSELGPESIITFPQGLVGQPNWKRFVLVTEDDNDSVGVLQSVDDHGLSLMVISPKRLVPEYVVVLTPTEWTTLGLADDQQPVVLTTLSTHGEQISANLLGPLVINPRNRQAMQIVLADTAYSTRYPVGEMTAAELD